MTRVVLSVTAILLFAGGVLLAGSIRVYPIKEGVEDSPVLVPPRPQRILLHDRGDQAAGVSDYPVVGVLYGLILAAVAVLLYLVPGA